MNGSDPQHIASLAKTWRKLLENMAINEPALIDFWSESRKCYDGKKLVKNGYFYLPLPIGYFNGGLNSTTVSNYKSKVSFLNDDKSEGILIFDDIRAREYTSS